MVLLFEVTTCLVLVGREHRAYSTAATLISETAQAGDQTIRSSIIACYELDLIYPNTPFMPYFALGFVFMFTQLEVKWCCFS